MHPAKARYVAACQQLLVLVAVAAALAPAVGVVTLDVVHDGSGRPAGRHDAGRQLTVRKASTPSPAPSPRSRRAEPHRPR